MLGQGRAALPRAGHGTASRNAGLRLSFRRREGEKPDEEGGAGGELGSRLGALEARGPRIADFDSLSFGR